MLDRGMTAAHIINLSSSGVRYADAGKVLLFYMAENGTITSFIKIDIIYMISAV